MNSIECTKQKIREIVSRSKVPEDPAHSQNTLAWLLKLKPDAVDELQIAALGHDIERALTDSKVLRTDFANYDEFKVAHALNSAEILREIMLECGVQGSIIEDVYCLVCRHETGGDQRADLIRDADSISFFDVNLPLFYAREGWKATKNRCIWGFKRLSPKMKDIVIKLPYDIKKLNELVKSALDEANNDIMYTLYCRLLNSLCDLHNSTCDNINFTLS